VIKSLKKQKGEKLNCTVSADIIEESADYMVAKVTLKFENFTKTNLFNYEISQTCSMESAAFFIGRLSSKLWILMLILYEINIC